MRAVTRAMIGLVAGGMVGFLCGSFSQAGKRAAQLGQADEVVAADGGGIGDVGADDPELGGSKSPVTKMLLRADHDPWGALAHLEREVKESVWHLHRDAYRLLFRAWATRDLESAIRALGSIRHGSPYEAVAAVLDVAFENDPQRAAEVMREWRRFAGLPNWLKENPLEACELFPKVTSGQDGADHFSFPKALVNVDPNAGLEWALSLSGPRRTQMVEETVAAWAGADVDGAIATYGDGTRFDWRTRQEFEKQISLGLSKRDPREALIWLEKTGLEPHERANAKSRIVREWAKQDVDAVIEWTREQSILDQKQAMGEIAGDWATQDVEAAAEFYLSVGPESQSDRSAATQIASVWVETDPAAALDWVDQLPMGTRSPTETELFRTLFRRDRELAVAQLGARLRRLSPPTVERFSADYFKADLDAARAWLATVPDGLASESARRGIAVAADEKGGDKALLDLARELDK